jgi:cyclin-dependent kinase-like
MLTVFPNSFFIVNSLKLLLAMNKYEIL